jgi:hypothetical protein
MPVADLTGQFGQCLRMGDTSVGFAVREQDHLFNPFRGLLGQHGAATLKTGANIGGRANLQPLHEIPQVLPRLGRDLGQFGVDVGGAVKADEADTVRRAEPLEQF